MEGDFLHVWWKFTEDENLEEMVVDTIKKLKSHLWILLIFLLSFIKYIIPVEKARLKS